MIWSLLQHELWLVCCSQSSLRLRALADLTLSRRNRFLRRPLLADEARGLYGGNLCVITNFGTFSLADSFLRRPHLLLPTFPLICDRQGHWDSQPLHGVRAFLARSQDQSANFLFASEINRRRHRRSSPLHRSRSHPNDFARPYRLRLRRVCASEHLFQRLRPSFHPSVHSRACSAQAKLARDSDGHRRAATTRSPGQVLREYSPILNTSFFSH